MGDVRKVVIDGKSWVMLSEDDYEDLLDRLEAETVLARVRDGEETWPIELVRQLMETDSRIRTFRKYRGMTARDLAKAAGMSTGKAHPYLVSFLKVGFVDQDAAGRYELGPLALQLGMAKLRRLDPVKEASPLIEGLAVETGQSIGHQSEATARPV